MMMMMGGDGHHFRGLLWMMLTIVCQLSRVCQGPGWVPEEDSFYKECQVCQHCVKQEFWIRHQPYKHPQHQTSHQKSLRTRFEKEFFASYFSRCHRHLGQGHVKWRNLVNYVPTSQISELPAAAPTFWRKMTFNLRPGCPGQVRLARSEVWW